MSSGLEKQFYRPVYLTLGEPPESYFLPLPELPDLGHIPEPFMLIKPNAISMAERICLEIVSNGVNITQKSPIHDYWSLTRYLHPPSRSDENSYLWLMVMEKYKAYNNTALALILDHNTITIDGLTELKKRIRGRIGNITVGVNFQDKSIEMDLTPVHAPTPDRAKSEFNILMNFLDK